MKGDSRFTLVFEGDIHDLKLNPFKTDTPFGRPIAASTGDLLEENDELLSVIEALGVKAE